MVRRLVGARGAHGRCRRRRVEDRAAPAHALTFPSEWAADDWVRSGNEPWRNCESRSSAGRLKVRRNAITRSSGDVCVGRWSATRIIRHDPILFPYSKLTAGSTGCPIQRFPGHADFDGPITRRARDMRVPGAPGGGRMKIPKRLAPLLEEGLIDEVIGQLMSGKEATVYVVRSGDSTRCAKVYKDAKQRSFRQAASYRDGRKVKNSRQARAMEKGTRYGRQMQEASWQNAEVDALFRLAGAGVRVPQPYICTDGVLLMELVVDEAGDVAPRLNDVDMTEARALELHALLLNQVVRMLCAGLIHGDLSEYNILLAADGPVIIDLPQVVDAAGNNEAASMLKRDVDNLAA